jgi:hypothetical protein
MFQKVKKNLSLREKFFGKKIAPKKLPPNFFEKILDCEVRLKSKFNEKTLQELVTYYSMAIEYFESIGDQRYIQYHKSMNLLFSEPEVINYMSGGKNFKIEERKRKLQKKFEDTEKEVTKENVKTFIRSNSIDKKPEINNLIDKELNSQKSNFQKRKEAKKKKYLLSTSDITDNVQTMKNKRHINNNLNKSVDIDIDTQKEKIENTTNILDELKDNDLDLSSDNIINKKDIKVTNKTKFIEKIKTCMDVYFTEYYDYFTNKIVSGVIKDYENNSKYHSKLLCDSAVGFATQEKEMEFLITPQSDEAFKEQILGVVSQLKEESKTEIEKYNKNNLPKLKKINEKYSQDIIKNPGIELIQEKFKLDITNLLSSRLFN